MDYSFIILLTLVIFIAFTAFYDRFEGTKLYSEFVHCSCMLLNILLIVFLIVFVIIVRNAYPIAEVAEVAECVCNCNCCG